MKILITGAAGFIGFHTSNKLLGKGNEVIGIDNLNDYYDVNLKKARLQLLKETPNFTFIHADLSDKDGMQQLFHEYQFDIVINLAAQAGVRYSLENPYAYIDSNLLGFCNILEGCRHTKVGHLVYASTSSVYGLNSKQPFSEHESVEHPVSLYAATKKANEMMAHSYAHLYGLPCTGLRFFTVYGPWGRPDMAYFKFTKNIVEGKPIEIYNNGDMLRDFTYIDDIVEGIMRIAEKPAQSNPQWNALEPDPATSSAPYRIYNIGNHNPVKLMDFINALENALGKKAGKIFLPMQAGDVYSTFANVDDLVHETNFQPNTPFNTGIKHFVDWYKKYYRVG